jgi:murein DD-endopeptidase MepM/ murein hydrolase activator NlpD
MTRLGWGILAGIVLLAAAFVAMTRFGTADPSARRATLVEAIREPAATALTPAGQLTIPVAGVRRSTIADSWNDPREGGSRSHHGTDIMAPAGTPVLAAAPGRVEKLFQSARGGTTLYIRSPDGRWVYYYAHLSGYAPGIAVGQAVKAGQTIAYVGDTGDAGAGNYHLHFGLQRMKAGERWYQGEDVNPFPMLARRGAPR